MHHCTTWGEAIHFANARAALTGRRQRVRRTGTYQHWWTVREVGGAA